MKNAEMSTLIREQAETIVSMGRRIDDLSVQKDLLQADARRVSEYLLKNILKHAGKNVYDKCVVTLKNRKTKK